MGPSIGGICILCQHVARRTFFAAFLRGDKRLLFIWIGFLSCAYIMGEDKHMRVTAIVEQLPQRVRAVIRIIMDVIMIVVFLYDLPPFFELMGKVTYSGLLRLPLKYIAGRRCFVFLVQGRMLLALHVGVQVVNTVLVIGILVGRHVACRGVDQLRNAVDDRCAGLK